MTDTLTHTDQIPRELRALPRWCVTQVVRKGETSRKLILTPGMAGKRLAASDDPGTWRDFETARRDAEARGLYLTFVFDRSLPYFFIDADEVVSPTGEITDWAQDLVEGLETYTEVSASGDGLHIIGRGAFGERSANPAYPVERYPLHGPRFCLFTGQTLPGHDTIEERAHHLAVAFPERAYHTNGATSGAGYTGPVGELSPAEVGGIVGWAKPYWSAGRKHPMAVYLSGYLAKAGVSLAQTLQIIERCAENDQQPGAKLVACEMTYADLEAGESVAGWQGLQDVCHLTTDELADLVRIINGFQARMKGASAASDPVSPLDLIFTAQSLNEMVFPEPRWAIPNLIPEGATLLVGGPKLGKSWLMLGAALSIAYGGKALGTIDVEQGEVLLLCLEDNPRRLQQRLRMMVGDDPLPSGLQLVTDWPRLDQGGGELLAEWAAKHPDARMIGIDVLAKMRPPRSGQGDLYAMDYALMNDIKRIADGTVPIACVHHSRKASADDPFDRISGTNGLAAATDTALILSKERGSSDANLYLRGRDVIEADYALRFDAVCGLWSVVGDPAFTKLPEGRQEILALVTLKGPMLPSDVADALGRNRSTTRTVMRSMLAAGLLRAKDGMYDVVDRVDSVDSTDKNRAATPQTAMPWE
jgi:hypothetical protein